MDNSSLADILAAVFAFFSTVIAALTLFMLRKQLKDMNVGARTGAYQAVYEKMIDIDKFFIANPSLKLYFYCNSEKLPEDEIEKQRILSVAEMLVDFFDCIFYQREVMHPETFKAKAFYFGDLYNNSPAIRHYLNQDNLNMWYSKDFHDFILEQAKLAKIISKSNCTQNNSESNDKAKTTD
jgi:hypothetical protein